MAVTTVTTESLGDARAAPSDLPTSAPGRRVQPRPQSGLLTAGEHDDLLNPELYADYVRRSDLAQDVRALPVLDTARLITVEVKDARGRPAPFVPVELRCADGNSLTFTTQADGTVVFFPGMDRLSDTVRVRAAGGDWRVLDVPRTDGTGRVGFTLAGQARPVTRLDLALVVDVTGSMSDELNFLQAELDSIVASLNRRHPDLDIRVGLTFYRDKGDEFVTRTFPFTGDIARARGDIGQQVASGGGDYEEAMQDALVRAAKLDWRPDAIKTLLLVADAPPHAEDVPRAWLAAENLRANRVQVVPVGASGVGDLAEYVMRAMAAATQSRYAFLTDDSGIGNPHAPSAIDCYLVTRLDKLLTRIIDSQVSGRRIEPGKADVIRAVGQYDAGKCVLPKDFGTQVD
ncbi:vWA domain-containing protein [Novosphingobium resinovorum]|uniref:vWA domain-containing protein n=1 Tax=Novosphingobium resinovorum TaxID=158500 RepID=UPI002ED54F6E|nr:VWA domain-containing protein [Novosphingobium resinovorum]